MGRVAFSEENKGKVVSYEYPKFKLDQGEKARAILGLEDPAMEYVHTLRKPLIENGRAVTEEVTNERTNTVTTEYKKAFVGTPICLGDESVIADKGLDPKHCPACRLAQEHPDMAEPPKRRFAMHIIVYKTKAGTFQPVQPFSVEIKVWSFTDMVFNKLVEFKQEWKNLLAIDFNLGPCTNKNFQKFDIVPAAEAIWTKDPEFTQKVRETFANQQIPDLTIAIGRQVQPAWMEQDIIGIKEAWAQARQSEDRRPGATASLDTSLNDLLGGASAEPEPAKDAEGWAIETGDEGIDAALGNLTSLSLQAEAAKEAEPADGDAFAALLASEGSTVSNPADLLAVASEEASEPVTVPDAAPAVDNFDDLLGLKSS